MGHFLRRAAEGLLCGNNCFDGTAFDARCLPCIGGRRLLPFATQSSDEAGGDDQRTANDDWREGGELLFLVELDRAGLQPRGQLIGSSLCPPRAHPRSAGSLLLVGNRAERPSLGLLTQLD